MDEFMRLVGSIGLKSDPEMEQEFEDALRFFDKDGRGLINAQQLKSALQSYGEPLENEDLNELMKMADVKGDGKIDYLGIKALCVKEYAFNPYFCHSLGIHMHTYIHTDRQTDRGVGSGVIGCQNIPSTEV